MSGELQALKRELRQKGSHNRPQDEELISAMREQVATVHVPLHADAQKLILNVKRGCQMI